MIPMKSFRHILLLISLFILNSPIYAIWLSVDPLSDKYPHISPYAYCGNNPVRFVDPDGMEIHIIGENDNITVYNTNTTYEGADKFTANIYDELNTLDAMLSNTDFMSSLICNSNIYKVSPTNSTIEGTHSFVNETINIGTNHRIESLGHELFHAYQDVKGQGGASIHNEVEAYLFQSKIVFMNGGGILPLHARNDLNNNFFENNVHTLIYGIYNQDIFNQVVQGFQTESNKNIIGVYNSYPLIRNNQVKSLIQSFYPICP